MVQGKGLGLSDQLLNEEAVATLPCPQNSLSRPRQPLFQTNALQNAVPSLIIPGPVRNAQ